MKFKKLLGLGLVGKVEGLVNRAGSPGSIYWPDKICALFHGMLLTAFITPHKLFTMTK